MTMQQIILDILQRKRMSKAELAKALNTSKQNVGQILKNDDIRVSTVLTILDILGYEFVIRRKR